MIAPIEQSGRLALTRGRPLVMLAALLVCWVGMRAAIWESPFPNVAITDVLLAEAHEPGEQVGVGNPGVATAKPNLAKPAVSPMRANGSLERPIMQPLPAPWSAPVALPPDSLAPPPPFAGKSAKTAAAHQLLYLAAMSNLPVPQFLAQGAVTPAGPETLEPPVKARSRADRWSLDAWVFWREGSGSALATAGRVPSYGASQTAGVLRYRIAPESKHNPRAYFRAYRALIDGGEGELASGLSARPIAALPIRAHAEIRATRFDEDWDVRPAAFATTEFAPFDLPASARAEIYLQGGYVGGENATAFADGQVHILRDMAEFDIGKLTVGAAAWGGAQEGAERFDIGPSLRLDLKIDKLPGRISLDWRERVAGDASPDSGVALTLSTRF